jgi:hypothetical protein
MIFQLYSFGSKSNSEVLKILCHHAFKILNHFVNIVSDILLLKAAMYIR